MFEPRRREGPRIEISSLVDVVFLLLIFFMVTTRFAEEPAVDIELPTTEGEATQLESELPALTVDRSNRIFLEGDEISLEQLQQRLDARFAAGGAGERNVTLKADQAANWQTLSGIFDALAKAEVGSVLAPTDPGPMEPSR